LSLDIIGVEFFNLIDVSSVSYSHQSITWFEYCAQIIAILQEEWGQAAASLVQVSLPVKLQLPEQNTLNSSLEFDITCKLAFKSKRTVVLRALQRLEKRSVTPVQFCMQVSPVLCVKFHVYNLW
jgi:hypothetical protein